MPEPIDEHARWVAGWFPSRRWAASITDAHAALVAGADGAAAAYAWAAVAMMLGDTGAAAQCLVVCLHAEAGLPAGAAHRIAAHRDLAMIDLGLARPRAPGPIVVRALGAPGEVVIADAAVAAWVAAHTARFEGELAAAAWFVLRVAAIRLGLAPGPEPALPP